MKMIMRGHKAIGCILAVLSIAVVCFLLNGCGSSGISPKSTVNDYSWSELSAISDEISEADDFDEAIQIAGKYNLVTDEGKLDGTQTKDVELSDGRVVQVEISGFFHDDREDGSKTGIAFIFKDAIAKQRMNSDESNEGGWEDSSLRSWLNSDGLDLLPDNLKGVIVPVKKLTNNVGETEMVSSVTVTVDSLWLYSTAELCGRVELFKGKFSFCNDVLDTEGYQYRLFRDAGTSIDVESGALVRDLDGKSCSWWERSAKPNGSESFYSVSDDVASSKGSDPENEFGVVPGFCI